MSEFTELVQDKSLGYFVRFWRKEKGLSQIDLAFKVGISNRHLSFIETGKSKPTRELVLRLGECLSLSFRHQNSLLFAAGYAHQFKEESLEGERLKIVKSAIEKILANHNPLPAFAIDKDYKIIMVNQGYENLLRYFSIESSFKNSYRLTFSNQGFKPYIKDWAVLKKFLLRRLWMEATSSQNINLLGLYSELSDSSVFNEKEKLAYHYDLPVASFTLNKEGKEIQLFTTITTVGTPLDIISQELKIEMLFPVNQYTDYFLNHLKYP